MKNSRRIMLVLIPLGLLVLLSPLVTLIPTRDLTGLESFLLQIISLAAGLVGSYIFSRQSAQKTAREIVKSHAKPAFRGLLSLYAGLSRTLAEIRSLNHLESSEDYQVILARIDATLTDQLMTADNALETWRDIVPEDVEELERRLSSDDTTEG